MAKSWSKIKKELEQEWMCNSTRGRVTYFMTTYRKSHDQRGRIAVLIDGEEIHESNDITTEIQYPGFFMPSEVVMMKAQDSGFLHTQLFVDAYYEYSNQDISASIHSSNALIRLFAIFDRRIGHRSFVAQKDILIGNASWLEPFYNFRLECLSRTSSDNGK